MNVTNFIQPSDDEWIPPGKRRARVLAFLDIDSAPSLVDLMDEVSSCCETDRERQVILLRAEGHTLTIVAAKIGVSTGTVQRDLRRIEERYNSLAQAA